MHGGPGPVWSLAGGGSSGCCVVGRSVGGATPGAGVSDAGGAAPVGVLSDGGASGVPVGTVGSAVGVVGSSVGDALGVGVGLAADVSVGLGVADGRPRGGGLVGLRADGSVGWPVPVLGTGTGTVSGGPSRCSSVPPMITPAPTAAPTTMLATVPAARGCAVIHRPSVAITLVMTPMAPPLMRVSAARRRRASASVTYPRPRSSWSASALASPATLLASPATWRSRWMAALACSRGSCSVVDLDPPPRHPHPPDSLVYRRNVSHLLARCRSLLRWAA